MKTQEKILDMIREYISEHQYAPSIREITHAVGLKSPSTVHGHLHRLQEKGVLTLEESSPRTVVLHKRTL